MIAIKNLHKKFNESNVLFENLSFKINENELTFILGKSGSGKTTLLNLIGGIDNFDSGTIEFRKQKPTIDFVFQDYNLIENLNLKDNLKLGLNILGRSFDEKSFENYSKELNLYDKSEKTKMEQLSGGEKQRVAIIRALSRDSDIILADEPTGNLDSTNTTKIFENFKKLSKSKTIVIVTHDEENARKFADRIIELEDGKLKNIEILNDNLVSKNFEIKESKIYEKSSFKISNKNKLSIAPKIFKKDFKRKFFQFLLIFFSISLSLLTVGVISQSSLSQSQLSQNTNVNFLQTDKVDVSPDSNQGAGVDSILTSEQATTLEKDFGVKKVISKKYSYGSTYSLFSDSKDENNRFQLNNTFYQSVDNSDFFANRLNFKNTEGELLHVNPGEVIVGQNVLNALKIQDPIGKTINLTSPSGNVSNPVMLKIIAVNSTPDPLNNILTYINVKDFNVLEEKIIANAAEKKDQQFVLDLKEKIPGFDILDTINSYKLTYSTEQNTNPTITSGRNIKNPWEILLSNDLKAQYEKDFSSSTNLERQELSSEYQLSPNVSVVGYFEANAPNQMIMRSEDFDYLKTLRNISYDFYLNSPSDISNFSKKVLEINPKLSVFDNLSQVSQIVSNNFGITQSILIVFLSIVIVLMFIFVAAFSKILVDSKQKEIGILKVLGGSKKLISFFHVNNILVTNFAAYLFSIILYSILAPFLNTLIFKLNTPVDIGINIGWITLAWFSIIVTTTIIYYLFSLKTFRKKTVDLLR